MVLSLISKGIHSLKEKRQIVSSIKEKLKYKYNISIIESDFQNSWQKIQLALAMVSHSKDMIEKTFDQIEDFIYLNYPVQLITVDKEFL
jgi:uncharacterized protein YlxP (DUF503 family)